MLNNPPAKLFDPFVPPVISGTDGPTMPKPNGNGNGNGHPKVLSGVVGAWAQLRRAIDIARHFVWFVVRAKLGRWSSRDDSKAILREAVWLRENAEKLGGTFVKLAQQASIRRDVLPEAYCDELAKLQDRVPPIELADVRRIIESQIRKPLPEVFSYIDPTPVGSASIGCVYRAVLKDGSEVAVKIRRPGIEREFALDLAVMDRTVAALELLGLSSMGLSAGMVDELRSVLAEELNFASEIRYQELFRRNFKKYKAVNITAPKVNQDLSGSDVIVTEFAHGIRLKDILSNLQAYGEHYRRFLKRIGIDHKDIGRRLVRGQHFQVHECPFFHADPHPGNIIIQPGGRIVFLDFGACGVLSERDRNLVLEMNRRFFSGDVVGMVQCVTGIMEPLPRIDTDAFTALLEKEWWQGYYGIIDKHAAWYERTSFRLWTALLVTLRKSDIELPTRMLKLVRATLLYDTVAAQLDNKINVFAEFEKYAHWAAKRQRREMKKAMIRQAFEGPDDWVYQRFNQVEKIAARVLFVAEKLLNEPNLRLDASFNIVIGVITEIGSVLQTAVAMSIAFGLIVYSYTRYLRVYEPQNYLQGGDFSALPFKVFESVMEGSISGFVMATAVAIGLFLGALNLLAVYQRLRRLFGQHDKEPK